MFQLTVTELIGAESIRAAEQPAYTATVADVELQILCNTRITAAMMSV